MILHTVNQLGKNIDNMFNISHSASNVKLQSIYIAHLESFVNHNSNEIYQICKIWIQLELNQTVAVTSS